MVHCFFQMRLSSFLHRYGVDMVDEEQDDPAFDEKEELDAGIPYNEFPWLRETLREESQKLRDGFRSPNIKIKLYKAQNGRCNAPCGKNGKGRKFPIDIFEVDHIDPRSKGGKDIDENLQLLCPTCNRRKGNMPMQDFVDKFAQKKIPFDK